VCDACPAAVALAVPGACPDVPAGREVVGAALPAGAPPLLGAAVAGAALEVVVSAPAGTGAEGGAGKSHSYRPCVSGGRAR
jgi:hypothetical protein